ncbi:MAG TPA: FGGY-family carbohydrate kinase, partial [Polyangiaceae bacterium]|nr:FGGY-family carbohydrate kinase [Polyangiaceae bacterium]
VLVPALAGLGDPYWNADARGLITGITRGTTAAHLAYATLEGIAHEVSDLLEAMRDDMGKPMGRIRVDGAAAANDLLMQMQADLAGIIVERPKELETTARGAAMLAAIGLGVIDSPKKASGMFMVNRVFQVEQTKEQRDKRRNAWSQAVRRAQTT